MGDVDELTKEFVAESLDGLDRMDRCLTELELRPNDRELLAEIFRSVHTIKGTTGFLGFSRLEKLAHAGETLLGALREGRLTATPGVVSVLLQLMDGLRAVLRLIELTGKEGTRATDEDSALIARMEELNRAEDEEVEELPLVALEQPERRGVATGASAAAGMGEKTLRLDVDVLNRMMNLVGELVLTRNQILQSGGEGARFAEQARRLDSVTADLRETVMQARMQPVGHVFGKFPRMVRDVAKACGKTVRIASRGQETGLDKSLLEAMKDPLAHAVRNAIDHGIEDAEARVLAGKAAEGLVEMRAYHHNGSVVIEVEDDGAGIATERVRAKAVERGLVTEEQAAAMTERQVLAMIFEPGFSTAATVTNVSGRGVGMDVVMANVERVGGTVELESKVGKGTLLRLRVPLTLAIVRALVVRSGGQSFCVPQSALAELVCVPRREAETLVEWIGEAELFRLRERLLPMVRLDRMLGLEGAGDAGQENGFYVAVLEADGCAYALVVDDLMVPEEIVVKRLSPVLREIGLFSGATVLGTGELAMILDVTAVGARAGVQPVAEAKATAAAGMATRARAGAFLVFEDHRAGERAERMALPLSVVVRIETVALSDVEYAGGTMLLQYRGQLVRLEDRGGVVEEMRAAGREEPVKVLICQRAAKAGVLVGLVVRRVLEVAQGDWMEQDATVCAERLARVEERVLVVHEAFGLRGWMGDVA